jgi:hypothetical protein
VIPLTAPVAEKAQQMRQWSPTARLATYWRIQSTAQRTKVMSRTEKCKKELLDCANVDNILDENINRP